MKEIILKIQRVIFKIKTLFFEIQKINLSKQVFLLLT